MPSVRACLKISTRSSVGSLPNAKSARVFPLSVTWTLSGPLYQTLTTRRTIDYLHLGMDACRGNSPVPKPEVRTILPLLVGSIWWCEPGDCGLGGHQSPPFLNNGCRLTTLTASKTVAPWFLKSCHVRHARFRLGFASSLEARRPSLD